MSVTDGEAWARRELRTLRAARWAARDVGAFLRRAHDRAARTRAARPTLVAQARRWQVAGAAAHVLTARRLPGPSLPGRLAWWGAVSVMLDWHLGMVETEDGTPVGLGAADALTLTRAWLVPALAARPMPRLLLAAAATDALDGAIARRTRTTRAGRDLEGIADAGMLVAALSAAQRSGALGRGPVRIELARQGAGAAFALASYFGAARPPSPAVTAAARATAPVRIAAIALAGAGRRRAADGLLTAGSVAAVAGLVLGLLAPSSEAERSP